MRDFLAQIEEGLKHNLYFLSLFTALTIPDICGAMESANGNADRQKYMKWFNEYVVKRDPDKYGDGKNLTAETCYYYRCALLHQGYTQHRNIKYRRILFIEPPLTTFPIKGLHACCIGATAKNKSLIIDVQKFCNDIVQGAYEWLKQKETDKNYKKNYAKMIKRYPKGIKPVFGCPIIG
jgi:hypothetical protein